MDSNPGPDRVFSIKEEQVLVDHIKYMTNIGYGYSKANVQYIVSDYAASCGKKNKDDKPMSDCWFYVFVKRWPDVKLAKPQKLSLLRAKNVSRDVPNKYFKELSAILTLHNLRDKPERIFNIDETGVSTEHAPPKILCESTSNPQTVTSPRSSNVTIIHGGNAAGNHIPPYYIFPGKRWNGDFMDGAPPGSAGEMSESGWCNRDIFTNYLTKHFVKHANISSSEKTLVLFDGHRSHISPTLVEWAKKHNIILFVLPPHTSHITQPLDVGVLGPFKTIYHRECQVFLQKNPGMKITKHDVSSLTSKPYLKAMSPENLISAFRKAGICPFDNKTITKSQVAPATIYPDISNDKENTVTEEPPELSRQDTPRINETPTSRPSASPLLQKCTDFLDTIKITTVSSVKKPRKKFVPPYLSGSLAKKINMDILASTPKAVKQTTQSKPTHHHHCLNLNLLRQVLDLVERRPSHHLNLVHQPTTLVIVSQKKHQASFQIQKKRNAVSAIRVHLQS